MHSNDILATDMDTGTQESAAPNTAAALPVDSNTAKSAATVTTATSPTTSSATDPNPNAAPLNSIIINNNNNNQDPAPPSDTPSHPADTRTPIKSLIKTNGTLGSSAKSDLVTASTTPSVAASPAPLNGKLPQEQVNLIITPALNNHLLAVVKYCKRHRDAAPFLEPVDPIVLKIPDYPKIISHPMDMSTIEAKLNTRAYSTMGEFMADFDLMFQNCYTYNGPNSVFTKMAKGLDKLLRMQMRKLPKSVLQKAQMEMDRIKAETTISTMEDSSEGTPPVANGKHETKEEKDSIPSSLTTTTTAETTPTLESAALSGPPGEANSKANVRETESERLPPSPPAADVSKQEAASRASASATHQAKPQVESPIPGSNTAAPGPTSAVSGRSAPTVTAPSQSGTPTKTSSASIASANAASKRTRNRKMNDELKHCAVVIKEIFKKQHHHITYPFLAPVDTSMYTDYLRVVKQPMDFGTIKRKLEHSEYRDKHDFVRDARLVFHNCYAFNPTGSPVHTMGLKVEQLFNNKWSERFRTPAPIITTSSSKRDGAAAAAGTREKKKEGKRDRKSRPKHESDSEDSRSSNSITATPVITNYKRKHHEQASSSGSSDVEDIPDSIRGQIYMFEQQLQFLSSQISDIKARFPSLNKRRKSSKDVIKYHRSSKKESKSRRSSVAAGASAPAAAGMMFAPNPWIPGMQIPPPGMQMPPPTMMNPFFGYQMPGAPGMGQAHQQPPLTPTGMGNAAKPAAGKVRNTKNKASKGLPRRNSAATSSQHAQARRTPKLAEESTQGVQDTSVAGKVESEDMLPTPANLHNGTTVPSPRDYEVTYEMKRELADYMPHLNEQQLSRVFAIIHTSLPGLSDEGSPEIELDIDSLDQKTVRTLYTFMKECMAGGADGPGSEPADTCPAPVDGLSQRDGQKSLQEQSMPPQPQPRQHHEQQTQGTLIAGYQTESSVPGLSQPPSAGSLPAPVSSGQPHTQEAASPPNNITAQALSSAQSQLSGTGTSLSKRKNMTVEEQSRKILELESQLDEIDQRQEKEAKRPKLDPGPGSDSRLGHASPMGNGVASQSVCGASRLTQLSQSSAMSGSETDGAAHVETGVSGPSRHTVPGGTTIGSSTEGVTGTTSMARSSVASGSVHASQTRGLMSSVVPEGVGSSSSSSSSDDSDSGLSSGSSTGDDAGSERPRGRKGLHFGRALSGPRLPGAVVTTSRTKTTRVGGTKRYRCPRRPSFHASSAPPLPPAAKSLAVPTSEPTATVIGRRPCYPRKVTMSTGVGAAQVSKAARLHQHKIVAQSGDTKRSVPSQPIESNGVKVTAVVVTGTKNAPPVATATVPDSTEPETEVARAKALKRAAAEIRRSEIIQRLQRAKEEECRREREAQEEARREFDLVTRIRREEREARERELAARREKVAILSKGNEIVRELQWLLYGKYQADQNRQQPATGSAITSASLSPFASSVPTKADRWDPTQTGCRRE